MSGGSAPAAPDYTPVANADIQTAQIDQQTAEEQLAWAKQQYADQAPETAKVVDSLTNQMDQQTSNAENAENEYRTTFQPMATQFAQEAQSYDSADQQDQSAGAAVANASMTQDAARTGALAQLESYGIDPSQTRYSALDLGTRITGAAQQAAAGTQSRLNTQATGLALQGEAINIGNGLPSNVAQSYAGATSAGQTAVGSGLSTLSTYGNLMGTGTQWSSAGTGALGGAASALNMGYQDALGGYNANQQGNANLMSGVGSIVGGALGVAGLAGAFKGLGI